MPAHQQYNFFQSAFSLYDPEFFCHLEPINILVSSCHFHQTPSRSVILWPEAMGVR
jgi:hypothetical protein